MAGIKSISITAAGSSYETLPTVTIASGFITNLKFAPPTGIAQGGTPINGRGKNYIGAHVTGTATAGDATHITLETGASAVNDYYNKAAVYIKAGTGVGQLRVIADYVGSTRIAQVATWDTNPDSTSQYELGPAIAFSGGGGSGATAAAIVRGGSIQNAILVNRGTGYTTLPTVTVTEGEGASGTGASITAEIDVGAGATAVAKMTGTGIASVAVNNATFSSRDTEASCNALYTAVPTIVVTPSNGDTPTTTAVLTAVLTATSCTRITVTNAGTSGYTGTPSVTVSGSATATSTTSGGAIAGIALTGHGGSYTEPPTVTISGGSGDFAAVSSLSPTTIASVTVTTAGAGYTAPPTLTVIPSDKYGDQNGNGPASSDGAVLFNTLGGGIGVTGSAGGGPLDGGGTGPGGDGLGTAAALTPTMTSTTIESIQLTSKGNGYSTPPPITLTGGGGADATAASTLDNYNLKATQKAGPRGMTALKQTKQPDPTRALLASEASPFAAGGGRVPQRLMVGKLAMLASGLHRVVGIDSVSYSVNCGLQAEVTSHSAGATTFVIKLLETDTNLAGIAIPAATRIIFGGEDAGSVREVGITTAIVTFSSGSATFTLTGALTKDSDFKAGTPCRIQFIPGNTGSSTNYLLNKFKVNDIDPNRISKNTELVYHVGIGICPTPKFIGADGTYANTKRAADTTEKDVLNTGAFDGGVKDINMGGVRYDVGGNLPDDNTFSVESQAHALIDVSTIGGASRTFTGWTSPRLRVFHPAGVPKFTASDVGFRDNTGTVGALMINKTGFLTANETPSFNPNPTFMMWIGTGESNIPEFQIAANDEDIIDPRVVLVGYKYALEAVPEKQAKRMLRRSGGFRYEIIPHALDAYAGQNLGSGTAGPAAPAGGWSSHVKEHKGRTMNFEEWKQSTTQQTNQTTNILQGTSGRQPKRRGDPRATHRRDI